MFPKSHEFTIEGGTFNEAQTQQFYNITVICDKTSQSVEDHQDNWKTLISAVDRIVNNNEEEDKDEQPDDEEDPQDEESNPDDAKLPILKRFIFYTGVDEASKKLKRSTEVVLTLTPSTADDTKPLPTLVWKILRFEKTTSTTIEVLWSDEVGFCVLKAKADGSFSAGDLKKQLNPGYSVILKIEDGQDDFDEVFKIPHENNQIGLCNTTNKRQRFALCTIDPTKGEDRFLPVIDLQPFSKSARLGIQCGPPVMLQAYEIPGKQERTLIDTSKLKKPLFLNRALKPQAIDIRELGQVTSFRLYSKDSGKSVLERD